MAAAVRFVRAQRKTRLQQNGALSSRLPAVRARSADACPVVRATSCDEPGRRQRRLRLACAELYFVAPAGISWRLSFARLPTAALKSCYVELWIVWSGPHTRQSQSCPESRPSAVTTA